MAQPHLELVIVVRIPEVHALPCLERFDLCQRQIHRKHASVFRAVNGVVLLAVREDIVCVGGVGKQGLVAADEVPAYDMTNRQCPFAGCL